MTLDEAKALLNGLSREELQDYAFGDAEVYWIDVEGIEMATGYFGASEDSVGGGEGIEAWEFKGADARTLRSCGKRGRVERNDETGPPDYHEGECLPGLTLEGVKREIEG